jgi:hypothetical protein
VKRINGVNLGPVERQWSRDYREEYRQAGFSSVRLHDTRLFLADAVELHCIFPNPKADPGDPANYRFGLTDDYLQTIRDTGAEIYFRLGESIEHTPRKLYIRPDLWDPAVMATVCANIVRHYNEGWADGHDWAIKHWEFWNEPELGWSNPPEGRKCWTGTADQFFEYYQATAARIKALDTPVALGLAGFTRPFFAIPDGDPGSIPGWGQLVARCADAGLPVDFVSWHRYTSSWADITDLAVGTRDYLNRIGLVAAESHITEWHYMPKLEDDNGPFTFMSARGADGTPERYETALDSMTNLRAAAATFGVLVRLQDAGVDLAHHYTGIAEPWGLFTASGRPNKLYDAFVAFNEFTGNRVAADLGDDEQPEQVSVLAAEEDGRLRIGVAHIDRDPQRPIAVRADGRQTVVSARRLHHDGWRDAPTQVTADGLLVTPGGSDGVIVMALTA